MNIRSLLNSPSSDSANYRSANCPLLSNLEQFPDPVVPHRRLKQAKDAPIFTEGTKIVGHMNYPPHEAGDDHELQARHRDFQVFPLGQILRKGVRHIPYTSDKKDFLVKTGRDAFEVFQYTYKRPGEDKEYVVVWDYNVGLVRMTPFFKSCKYPKTVPAKALNQNPGMKEISYSITGGALVCQGYWVPYQAAREIAATFCYDIRWALTPVFGNDFPDICRPHCDRGLAKFVIDPEVVRLCTVETARFREEGTAYRILPPNTLSSVVAPVTTPSTLGLTLSTWSQVARAGSESGYGTDVARNDTAISSCQVSPRSRRSISRFSFANGAGLTNLGSPASTFASTPPLLPFHIPDGPYSESLRTIQACSDAEMVDSHETKVPNSAPEAYESGRYSPRTIEAAEILLLFHTATRHVEVLPAPERSFHGSDMEV